MSKHPVDKISEERSVEKAVATNRAYYVQMVKSTMKTLDAMSLERRKQARASAKNGWYGDAMERQAMAIAYEAAASILARDFGFARVKQLKHDREASMSGSLPRTSERTHERKNQK